MSPSAGKGRIKSNFRIIPSIFITALKAVFGSTGLVRRRTLTAEHCKRCLKAFQAETGFFPPRAISLKPAQTSGIRLSILLLWDGTAEPEGDLIRSSRRGGKTMRLQITGGYARRHSDLLAILSLVAVMLVVGSAIFYLGERFHVPAHPRIFAGPVSTM
jgi:hypothetical protein